MHQPFSSFHRSLIHASPAFHRSLVPARPALDLDLPVQIPPCEEKHWTISSRLNAESHTWEYQTLSCTGSESGRWIPENTLVTNDQFGSKPAELKALETKGQVESDIHVQEAREGLKGIELSQVSEVKGGEGCEDDECVWESCEVSPMSILLKDRDRIN